METKEAILQRIKDEVAREHHYKDWAEASECFNGDDTSDYRADIETDGMVDEVAKRYAIAMCQLQIQACIGEVVTTKNIAE